MNTKQALAKCFKYFLDPKHKAGFRNNDCVYYANGGNPTMCAIGCLLPVKFRARVGKVQVGVDALLDDFPVIAQFFEDTDTNVLESMQAAHDSWAMGHGSREDFLDHLQNMICYQETVEWLD